MKRYRIAINTDENCHLVSNLTGPLWFNSLELEVEPPNDASWEDITTMLHAMLSRLEIAPFQNLGSMEQAAIQAETEFENSKGEIIAAGLVNESLPLDIGDLVSITVSEVIQPTQAEIDAQAERPRKPIQAPLLVDIPNGGDMDERFDGVHLIDVDDDGEGKTTAERTRVGWCIRDWELTDPEDWDTGPARQWFCRSSHTVSDDHVLTLVGLQTAEDERRAEEQNRLEQQADDDLPF